MTRICGTSWWLITRSDAPWGLSTKIHQLCDGTGLPLVMLSGSEGGLPDADACRGPMAQSTGGTP